MRAMICAGATGLLLAAAAPPALAQPAGAEAEAMFRTTTLSLSAEGEAKVAPDLARISLGVTNQAATAAEAVRANAGQMGRVVAALRSAGVGVGERDIRTAQLSINPQYAYEQGSPPRLTGYQATNQVTVTARDLGKLGAILDAPVAAGANAAGGASFDLADRRPVEDEARLAAVKALQAKAELYARATGYRIVRLVSLGEGAAYGGPPPPVPMARSLAEGVPVTPVSPGEMTIQETVTGLFELGR